MATTTLVLKEPNANNETLIYLIVRLGNRRLKYSTGQKIHPKYWNGNKQRAKEQRQFPFYSEFNSLLSNYENCALNSYRRLINDREVPSLDRIKEMLDEQFKHDKITNDKKDFFPFIVDFIEHSNRKPYTIRQYKQCLRVLKEYQTDINTPITFDSIDLNFYQGFTKYLTGRGYYTNTIGGYIKNLKVFMSEAVERGITTNLIYKHKKFKTIEEPSESIYLTLDELDKIYSLELSDNERLEKVRDLFIIGCYTGLRFSDLTKLSYKNIIDGISKIKIQTEKTGEIVIIPLHKYVRTIIAKYNGGIPRVISNQKMNQYLKELGELAGIIENVIIHFTKGGKRTSDSSPKYQFITVHTARRSFATNAYLNDIPTISIMKITGHKTEKAFLKYIKISQEDNANKLLNHPFFN